MARIQSIFNENETCGGYSSQTVLRKFWFLWAFLFVVSVASLDEYNQSFNNARTGSVYDVLIDIAGGLFTVAAFYLLKMRGRKLGEPAE